MSPGKFQQSNRSGSVSSSGEARWKDAFVNVAPDQQRRAVKKSDDSRTVDHKSPGSNIKEKGAKLKDEMDNIIDEIDEVLEENAEDFVRNYIQRGGQ